LGYENALEGVGLFLQMLREKKGQGSEGRERYIPESFNGLPTQPKVNATNSSGGNIGFII